MQFRAETENAADGRASTQASCVNAGLDPDSLPESDPSAMDFSGAKAWKDIWGCGQGIAPVTEVLGTQAVVDRCALECEGAGLDARRGGHATHFALGTRPSTTPPKRGSRATRALVRGV